MRPGRTTYPVDRYLVESNKKVEMVNIIDDEIWNIEPALRPEDEIILKKLHDMLQSTADDLKLLSGELSKINQPGVEVTKSQPAPLDEEFNEKVHIEEIVNAKFHGHKIVEKTLPFTPEFKPNKDLVNELLASKIQKPKSINTSVQVNSSLLKKEDKTKHLKTTRLQTVNISENNVVGSKSNLLNNEKPSKPIPTVSYNEISHDYVKVKQTDISQQFTIQNMPSINIRSELSEQRVFQLDILPESKDNPKSNTINKNIGVVEVLYEYPTPQPSSITSKPINDNAKRFKHQVQAGNSFKIPVRKISKMSTCESSESTNNVSSDTQHKLNIHKQHKLATKISPKRSARTDARNKKNFVSKKPEKRSFSNLDEWKHKLNSIYGQPSNARKGSSKSKMVSPKKSNLPSKIKTHSRTLNNGEYVPYSKLTLGGVGVSDIEREINDIPNKKDLELSPILDKILSSRENSFHNDSPRKKQHTHNQKVLTTSDENLLQEVMDIEKTVSETLSKEFKTTSKDIQLNSQIENLPSDGSVESYADDFEDEKSHQSESSKEKQFTENNSDNGKSGVLNESHYGQNDDERNHEDLSNDNHNPNLQNMTYTKQNLSFKDTVDIFEYVHSVDTQETGTQSNSTSKISLKETQTSPRNDRNVIQPIHNDLWPSIDPKGEIESLFQIEKEFIKKLIIDEYGEIIENNIMKPSSSKDKDDEDWKKNVGALQKNTQTSPARVKCTMTSPTKTKTRTTSPFSLSLTVDRQTSPMMAINSEELKIVIDNEPEDLGISINLSSPRFSLRLPQNSREVLSNLDNISATSSKTDLGNVTRKSQLRSLKIHTVSSSSSIDADNSSSEISSLGEVKLKLKKKNKKTTKVQIQSMSVSSSSSVVSQHSSDIISGDILPLKSEGEVSLGQAIRRPRTHKESEGEINFRPY